MIRKSTISRKCTDRNFDIKDDILRVENDPDDENRLNLTINRKPIAIGSGNNGTGLDMEQEYRNKKKRKVGENPQSQRNAQAGT